MGPYIGERDVARQAAWTRPPGIDPFSLCRLSLNLTLRLSARWRSLLSHIVAVRVP